MDRQTDRQTSLVHFPAQKNLAGLRATNLDYKWYSRQLSLDYIMDKQTDKETDGQTGRQTEIETDRQTNGHR